MAKKKCIKTNVTKRIPKRKPNLLGSVFPEGIEQPHTAILDNSH